MDTLKVFQDEYVLNWCLLPPQANLASTNDLCLDLWSHLALTFHPYIQLVSKSYFLYLLSLSSPFYLGCQLLWLSLLLPSGFLFCFVCLQSNFSSLSSHPAYCFCVYWLTFSYLKACLPVACIIKSKLFSLMLIFLCSLALLYLTRFLLCHHTFFCPYLLQPGLTCFFSKEYVCTPLLPVSLPLPQIVWPTTFALWPSLNF